MENVKQYAPLYILGAFGILCLSGMIVSLVLVVQLLKADEIQTCEAKKKELGTVANISNATGQLPDGTRLKVGEQVNVKADYCK